MDIPRPEARRKKRIRQAALAGGSVLLLVLVTVGIGRLEPAAPTVTRATVWVEAVQEGEMLRQVRGPGTLVPREIRWIAAQTGGRVERVVVRAGAVVTADTLLVEMSNADLQQQTEEAFYVLEAARAEFADAELRLNSQHLDQRAALGVARAE